MNIHWIQHVAFEGLGCIEPWLEEQGHSVSCSRLWAGDALPDLRQVDGLIVMGGPMGIYDDADYEWLADEKDFIGAMIEREKPVLGICLGAQLIADVLDASVDAGYQKEIGLFSVSGDGDLFPETFTAFHWHGDTFEIPEGATRLASSAVTPNQAFRYEEHVIGLQFHLETTPESLRALYEFGADELVEAPSIQFLDEVEAALQNGDVLEQANELMADVLAGLFG